MEDKEATKIKNENLKPHPKASASFLSHYLFCWEVPLFIKGWKKEIDESDLFVPLKEYDSKRLGDKLEDAWNAEKRTQKKPSLLRVLVRLFGTEYFLCGLLYLPFEVAVAIAQPYFLCGLLEYFTDKVSLREAYLYAGGLSVLCLVRVLSFHWFFFQTFILGMKINVASSSLIYRCSLKLKKDEVTIGHIVNLLSNDVSRFNQFGPVLHYVWIGPIQLIIGCFYIDVTVGHTALAGVTAIVFCLVLQLFISNKLSIFRRRVAEKTDDRIRLMNDIICGVQAIKLYTWEKSFSRLVQLSRSSELDEITKANNYRLFNNTFKIYLAKFCVYLCILTAILTQTDLTSQYLFTLTSIYESFKICTTVFMPMGVILMAETLISVQRIEECLQHDLGHIKKSPRDVFFKTFENLEKRKPGISLQNVSVKLGGKEILTNIDFGASFGDLMAVIGTAGSGKSTLLQVILKEVEPEDGLVTVEGIVSYAPQEPWIFSSSIKQNIIFGEDFDLVKYQKVVRVCCLEHDFALMPHGDQTLVGERGVMLSGGQKARINLARAVYRDADIYLLDDPLSAVDSHVARAIFDDCLLGYLKGKCVVLVTHQVQFLQSVNICMLENGRIVDRGTNATSITPKESTNTETFFLPKYDLQEDTKEHRTTGTSDGKIYKKYCQASGSFFWTFVVLFLFFLGQLFASLGDYFVSLWIEGFTLSTHFYFYTGLVVLMVLMLHLSFTTFNYYCMKASEVLHWNMFERVINGRMKFFNQHSSGRILNRFSKDIGCIDELLPMSLMNIITAVLTGCAIIVIIVVLNYWMIFPTVVLLAVTVLLSVVFQPSNRNIKRTEGVTQSHIFAHVTSSLQGLPIIRSSHCERTLMGEFDNHQDLHSSAFYIFTAMFSSFGFWADVITAFYTIIVIWSFFLLPKTFPGDVGLAITQCLTLVGMVQYGMKTWSELDAYMTSVERVVEYSELDTEDDGGGKCPMDPWPVSGNVTFDSVTLKYNPFDPPVLKGVTFHVNSGEKVGIIGRTGAGKTSLVSSLFRLFPFDGTITIDGVDTKSVPLELLRSKISIIPQEPVLFLGTLRKNLDPFDDFNDEELWCALEELELKTMVCGLPKGLHSEVTERGSNFSVGERQLLCLVRAMLKNSKIIVLDEATANIDHKTDELIQKMIRKKFGECTVLTIAHRLNTVVDSDKILVMDEGQVVEYGTPYDLLQNKNGSFYKYVERYGEVVVKKFLEIAQMKT